MARRRRKACGLAANDPLHASADCWDLHAKVSKANRVYQTAEYRVYEKGVYGKGGDRQAAVARVEKLRQKYLGLEKLWKVSGC